MMIEYENCKKLWAGVLQQAIDDLNCIPKKTEEQLAKEDALRWIESNNVSSFSFIWVCEVLDLNYKIIRAGILNEILQTPATSRSVNHL